MSLPYENDPDSGVVTESRPQEKLKKPRMYKVLLHNDHYTTREFVVSILREVFHKTMNEATRIMLHVHTHGVGVAGVYTRDVAETKIRRVEQRAREEEHPLMLSLEPAEEE